MRVAQAAFGVLQPLPNLLKLLAATCGMFCLTPSSTPPALGGRAPPLPSACQPGRWAPVASRLAESPAACHMGCCRAGIAKPLRSSPDGPPGWQESSAPGCPLSRLSAALGWPAPRGALARHCGNLERCSAAGTSRTSRCPPGQPPQRGKAVSLGSPRSFTPSLAQQHVGGLPLLQGATEAGTLLSPLASTPRPQPEPPRLGARGRSSGGLCTEPLLRAGELRAAEPGDPGSSSACPSSQCRAGGTSRLHARPLVSSALPSPGL